MGISPNIIVLRCDEPLEESHFQEDLRCSATSSPTASSKTSRFPILYEAPLMLEKHNFSRRCLPRAAVSTRRNRI